MKIWAVLPYGAVMDNAGRNFEKKEIVMNELKSIMEKFVASGWKLISAPAQAWLEGKADQEKLLDAIRQADQECGSCGCELDPRCV